MRKIVGIAWKRFNIIASVIGDVQGRVIATLFYFTMLVPFGIGSRLFSDVLKLRDKTQQTIWVERSDVPHDIDSARQQG